MRCSLRAAPRTDTVLMHRCENGGEILNVGFLPHHMELQVSFFFFFPPNENKEPLTALEARSCTAPQPWKSVGGWLQWKGCYGAFIRVLRGELGCSSL